MAKTNPLYTVEDTFSGVNISAGASVYQFGAAADGKVQLIPKITNGVGNGDYIAWLTRQWEGVGAVSEVLGRTTQAVANGVTVFEFVTMQMQVKSGDVVEVMIDGLAGDTSVNGNIRIVSDNPSVLEQSDILSDATPFAGADVDSILVDTGTTLPATLSDMSGATFSTTTDSLEAIRDRGDVAWITGTASSLTAQEVWEYARRTLTMSQDEILAIQTGSDIAVLRGDTLSVPITGLGDLTDADKLYVTVRKVKSVGDDESAIQVEETAKLLYLNGASPVSPIVNTDADLVVDDATDGDITFSMNPVASTELRANTYFYDVQKITSGGVTTTMRIGSWTIAQDVTRAVT